MTELKNQPYEDEDLKQVIEEFETFDEEAETIMASARGKVQKIREKQKKLKKSAKDDLSIPRGLLSALLKQRKLERQLQKVADGVSEDEIEFYADASGQFSLLAATEDEPEVVSPAQRAAQRAAAAAKAQQDAEQEEGAAVLADITGEQQAA